MLLGAFAGAMPLRAVRNSRPVIDVVWLVGLFADLVSLALLLSSTTWLNSYLPADASGSIGYPFMVVLFLAMAHVVLTLVPACCAHSSP